MALLDTPKTLNGYPVIRVEQHKVCATVMVERKDDPMPYVVATWWPDLGKSWSWGHYCETMDEATTEFNEAATRNTARN